MGKSIKKKKEIEAEKQLQYIKTLSDTAKQIGKTAKFKKQEKKSLLNLPDFMLNHHLRINSIEYFSSKSYSIEKRAKEAVIFLYGR